MNNLILQFIDEKSMLRLPTNAKDKDHICIKRNKLSFKRNKIEMKQKKIMFRVFLMD